MKNPGCKDRDIAVEDIPKIEDMLAEEDKLDVNDFCKPVEFKKGKGHAPCDKQDFKRVEIHHYRQCPTCPLIEMTQK